MPLLELIILLIFVGVALYLVGQIPMDARILNILRVIVILVVVVYVLKLLFPGLGSMTVGG